MWHIDAEIVSLVFVVVLMVDLSKAGKLQRHKDRQFGVICLVLALPSIRKVD